MLTIRHVLDDRVTQLGRNDLQAALGGPGYVWVDLEAPTPGEESVLDGPELALHPLAVEDLRDELHLPKLDVYGDRALLTVHAVAIDTATVELETLELDVVLARNLLLTYHRRPVESVRTVARGLDETGPGGLDRPTRLLHRLLDVMADVFVPFVDLIERRLDVIEEEILTAPTAITRREIYQLQRDVIQLRRALVPQAEVIRRLGRLEGLDAIEPADAGYFADVYDHLFRIGELSDSYRQLLNSAMESYRSALNDRLNSRLTVLTMFSTLLLPLTVIAGIYGMNFQHMPELRQPWAYPAVLAGMAAILAGGVLLFRWRGWFGTRAEEQAMRRRRRLGDVLEIPVLGRALKLPAYGARAAVSTGRAVTSLPGRLSRGSSLLNGTDLDPDT